MTQRFQDRRAAGRRLAADPAIARFAGRDGLLVLALPRGGVPVGFEVATALDAQFDVFVVRKLGLPGEEEYAMGAVASGGVVVLDHALVESFGVPVAAVESSIAGETAEMRRREKLYRAGRPAPAIRGRGVLLVDDGLATGASMLAAVRALARLHPARVVVAVPVCAASSCDALANEVDEVVCLEKPEPFRAVGLWYEDFSQTSDEEVRALLAGAASRRAVLHGGAR